MKEKNRLYSVLIFAALYCYAIAAGSPTLSPSDFGNNSFASEENYFSDISSRLLCFTKETENSGYNFNYQSALSYINKSSGLGSECKNTELVIESNYFQYYSFSKSILINHCKSLVIFPFHYFF